MLSRRKVARVLPDDPVTADDRNYLAEQIEIREPMPGPGVTMERTSFGVIISASTSSTSNRWFYTTSSITAATRTGTTVSNSVLTLGSGSARQVNPSTDPTLIPDTAASDETIYNGLNGTIATNQFVFCNQQDDGKWLITIAWC